MTGSKGAAAARPASATAAVTRCNRSTGNEGRNSTEHNSADPGGAATHTEPAETAPERAASNSHRLVESRLSNRRTDQSMR
jgi:hypothetical protein